MRLRRAPLGALLLVVLAAAGGGVLWLQYSVSLSLSVRQRGVTL